MGYGARRGLRNCGIALLLAFPAIASAGTQELVALGDSLTAGYGLPTEEGFVPQLEAWLKAHDVDVNVVNAGVSGDTTAGGRARLDWSLTPETTALMVNLGGNDLLRGLDPAEARANLEAIVTEAKARGIKVLLVGMQAPGNYGPDYKAAFDAIYPDLAKEYGTALIPSFFAPITGASGDPADMRALMQPDGIHPNAEGVRRIVEALGPAIRDFLAGTS